MDVENLRGFGKVRIQVGLADRPATVGNVAPNPEVAGIHFAAPAAPVIGRAAEEALPTGVRFEVFQPAVAPLVDVVGDFGKLQSARFQQQHTMLLRGQLQGQWQARRAAAADADIEHAVKQSFSGIIEIGQHVKSPARIVCAQYPALVEDQPRVVPCGAGFSACAVRSTRGGEYRSKRRCQKTEECAPAHYEASFFDPVVTALGRV